MILGIEEYEMQIQSDMQNARNSLSMYQVEERSTLDGEWYEGELEADIYDVCVEVMTEQEMNRYKYRALKDPDLLKPQYMAEKINSYTDVITLYNTEYDKHRKEKVFGIRWYDNAIKKLIDQELKNNLVVM